MANIARDLTVADIERAKRTLEDKIAAAVGDAMAEFEKRTGFTPSAIDVNLVAVQQVADDRPNYILDRVRAEILIV